MSVEGTVCKPVGTRATSKKIFGFLIISVTAVFQSFFTTFFQSGFLLLQRYCSESQSSKILTKLTILKIHE